MVHLQRFATALCLVLACFFARADAQAIAVYGTFSPIHIGNAVTGNTTGLNSTYTTGGYWSEGLGGGATFRILPLGPAALGLDVRGSKAWQTQSADTLLVGLKLGAKAPVFPIKPYLQVSGGYIGSRATILSGPFGIQGKAPNTGFWGYEVLGGVDYKFLPHIDLRLIELGGGRGKYRSGATGNTPDITIFTLNTGVVATF